MKQPNSGKPSVKDLRKALVATRRDIKSIETILFQINLLARYAGTQEIKEKMNTHSAFLSLAQSHETVL